MSNVCGLGPGKLGALIGSQMIRNGAFSAAEPAQRERAMFDALGMDVPGYQPTEEKPSKRNRKSAEKRKRTSIQTRNAPYRWARLARYELDNMPSSFSYEVAADIYERPRVFCCSLADVFDNEVPAEWREELWQVIRDTPELDWLLLTKRIGNVERMLPADWGEGWPHVWLGITVVTQAEADRDIPKLLGVPAAVRWLSMEPLLGQIGIQQFLHRGDAGLASVDPLAATLLADGVADGNAWVRPALDWIVVGGESGRAARPMHPDWARSLRDQCAAAGVPFLFKQWGEYVPACHYYEDSEDEREAALEEPHVLLSARAGRWHVGTPGTGEPHHGQPPCDTHVMHRAGKKAAGRELDGVTHDEVPR